MIIINKKMPVPFTLVLSLLLSACASTQSSAVKAVKDIPLSPAFTTTNAISGIESLDSGSESDPGSESDSGSNKHVVDKWWRDFSDPQLNGLIDQALANNYSLQASLARIKQSQSRWDQAGSSKTPSVQLTAQQSRQWQDGLQQDGTTKDQWQLGLSASYELDFWGRIDSLDEQALQQLNASRAAKNIQTNTVVSQVALAWYGSLQESQQLLLLGQQQARIKNALEVIRGRYLRGKVNASDMWQQEQLLESINSDIIRSETALAIYKQQLALWTGTVSVDQVSAKTMPEPFHIPRFTDPIAQVTSDALHQRPDVKQAYAHILAAQAGLNVAQSNRYPRFTLSASYISAVDTPSDILNNWMTNLIAGLAVPLIDGDNLQAEVRRNQAVVEEAVANYRQVILTAMQEIEQGLINETQQFLLSKSLELQLQLANKTQQYLTQRYSNGAGDFLSLLTNQQQTLQLERQVLAADYQQLKYRIQLLTSLSHGRFSTDKVIESGDEDE
jgi:NodT family efflux transporter outer membrane factor (OMF) lipoprotein